MKRAILCFAIAGLIATACNHENRTGTDNKSTMNVITKTPLVEQGYSDVNGIKMYYEIYGQGMPLVLIHGGGSTIESNFSQVIPLLAKNHKVIALELQAHGRSSDRGKDSSFEQDADDVASLLSNLKIEKADFIGFSNGATTTLQIALRHPEVMNKMVLGSALYKRDGVPPQFWEFMKHGKLSDMPKELKDAYLAVNPDVTGLQLMHDRDSKRMLNFKDISDDMLERITVPALIIVGDRDIITPEHAIEMHRRIAGSKLLIVPGVHGEYFGEVTTLKSDGMKEDVVIPIIEHFLSSISS